MPSFFAMSTKSVQRKATRTVGPHLKYLSVMEAAIGFRKLFPGGQSFRRNGLSHRSKQHEPCDAHLLHCCKLGDIRLQRAHLMSTLYHHSHTCLLKALVSQYSSSTCDPGHHLLVFVPTCVLSETESQCTTQTEDGISTLYQEYRRSWKDYSCISATYPLSRRASKSMVSRASSS